MTDQARQRIELATVIVKLPTTEGEGLGVYVGNGVILTAAHCLPIDLTGGLALGDDHVVELTTHQGVLQVRPIAIEPMADIAALGRLDDQSSTPRTLSGSAR